MVKVAKRCLSVILSLAMLASLLCVPVYAATPCTLIVSDATATVTKTEKQTVDVNIDISELGANDGWASLSLYLYYDSTKMTYKKNVPGNTFKTARNAIQDEGGSVSAQINASKDIQDANNNGDKEEMCVSIASVATDSESNPARMTGNGTLWTITFEVNEDLESQELPLSLVCLTATVNGDTSAQPTTVGGKITVNGVTPEINAVKLDNANVTADGSIPVTVKATATSAKGTDLTNAVMWSVVNEKGAGVSIAPNGTITVAKDAVAGDYTITAAGKTISGSGGNNTGAPVTGTKKELSTGRETATLKVQRNESQITSVEISGVQDVTIPANDTNNVMQPTATVKDQYGDTMSNQTVSWSLDASDVSGVSINSSNGKVTVTNAAKDSIQNNQTFAVTATCGRKSESKTFQVKRADAVTTSITLSDVSNMIVPDDEVNATENVTATVKDQYDTPISNPTVAWSIAPKVTGVSIDNNGKITVTNEAKEYITDTNGKQFTVTAKSGDVTNTATVTVKRAASTATSMKVFKGDVELTGNTDTVIIPSTSTPNTYTYSAKVYDQYGSGMSETATISFTATTETDKVTYADGTVTVKQGATKDSTYTLTVSYAGLQSKITITAKDIDITWPTVSKKVGTYGDKWSDIVTFSGGSAKLNGTDVPGTFTLKNADDVPDVDATYQFVFKSNDGKYTVESSAYSDATIAKKNLTITAASDSKQYDGTALTKNAVADCTVTGLVNDDVLTAVTVNGSATNVADTATGNNKVSVATIKHGDVDKTTNYNISYVNGTLTITKAHLTIKANDKTITYGDAIANSGVEYAGLVNNEDGATVVSGLIYDYNYEQYGNVGDYTITPKGATAANYEITYQSGKLTVNKKTVGLTWNDAENLYYNGEAKNVTATATERVNTDNISVTVVGGKETTTPQRPLL